jgi:Fe-S-cluster containining protein
MHIFERFHKMFNGVNENTFNTCRKCGGACEHNKIGTLLPGEKEYMATKMGISISEFESHYLDILKMDDGTLLYLLKLGKLCPFLNKASKVCECRNFKPIFCKVYPVVFTIEAGKINFTIDNWCKLSQKETFRIYFESSIPLLLSIPIPFEWFMLAVSYDNLNFDYDKIQKYRNEKCSFGTFSLEELLSFKKTEVNTPSFYIDFDLEIKESAF